MIQNNDILIGLTGGIATGKSTVSNILKELGYQVIDSDQISREVVKQGKPAYNDIVEVFGKRILLEDGSINREKLGKIIFKSDASRKKLNSIVHPRVFEGIIEEINRLKFITSTIFVDIPLLFEARALMEEYNLVFQQIWMVYADEDTQIERLMVRDNISRDYAIDKVRAQMDVEEKRRLADKVIYNEGDINYLKENIMSILAQLQKIGG